MQFQRGYKNGGQNMSSTTIIALVTGSLTIIVGLVGIVYAKLNSDTDKNTEEIKRIKDEYVKKEDYNRQTDKLDAKLDKILDILMGGHRER